MACKDTYTRSALEELRKLATWIAHDEVSSDQLEAYMTNLLNVQLVELHSCCRYESMLLARGYKHLCGAEVAKHFRELACDLEKAAGKPPEVEGSDSSRPAHGEKQPPSVAIPAVLSPETKARGDKKLSGGVPEAIAAISGSAITVALLSPNYGSTALRLSAAAGCGLLSLLYAAEAVRLAWRKQHAVAASSL